MFWYRFQDGLAQFPRRSFSNRFFFCLPFTKDMKIKTKTHLSFFNTKWKTLISRFAFFIFHSLPQTSKPKNIYISAENKNSRPLSHLPRCPNLCHCTSSPSAVSNFKIEGRPPFSPFLPQIDDIPLVLGLLLSDFSQVYTFRAFPLFCEHESQYLGLFFFSYMGII